MHKNGFKSVFVFSGLFLSSSASIFLEIVGHIERLSESWWICYSTFLAFQTAPLHLSHPFSEFSGWKPAFSISWNIPFKKKSKYAQVYPLTCVWKKLDCPKSSKCALECLEIMVDFGLLCFSSFSVCFSSVWRAISVCDRVMDWFLGFVWWSTLS